MFHKDGLEPIVRALDALGVHLYSTGGTQEFIEKQGVKVTPVAVSYTHLTLPTSDLV